MLVIHGNHKPQHSSDQAIPWTGQQTALAGSSYAGLVAAGYERLQRHRHSSNGLLAIWQPLPQALISAAPQTNGATRSSTSGPSQPHNSMITEGADQGQGVAADGHGVAASSQGVAAEGHAWQMALVAELGLESPPTAICWLENLQAAAPAIAVAQGPANLTIFAQLPG